MTATPHIQRVVSEVRGQFDGLRFEFYNPRHIDNNRFKPWSQHAGSEPARRWYGNATDIYDPPNPIDSPYLDAVYMYLLQQKRRLKIRTLLWKVKNHHNHIHVDTWPMMKDNWWYKPPAQGGNLVTIQDDKTISDTFATEQDEPMLQLGDSGNAVAKAQKGYNGWVTKHHPEKTPLVVDGDYGPATAKMASDYQTAAGLPVTGKTDGIMMALLMEYVPDWIDNHTATSGIQPGDRITVTGVINESETN